MSISLTLTHTIHNKFVVIDECCTTGCCVLPHELRPMPEPREVGAMISKINVKGAFPWRGRLRGVRKALFYAAGSGRLKVIEYV
ncbi:hypothetical protein ACW0JT_06995 [Arthrobacter sp. SA17]